MDGRNKNVVIGGLLAIVLVMAVGYAAFATQLNINGTATISSKWDVHFDTTKTTGAGVIDPTTGLQGATAPTGTIAYDGNLKATLTTTLNQPGDKVVYTLTIKNDGTLGATTTGPTLTLDNVAVTGLTATKTNGHIKYTVTAPQTNPIVAGGSTTMTVTAEFIDVQQGETVNNETAVLDVDLTYTQA